MKEFWNKRYAEKEFAYGKKPNLFFSEKLKALPPGKILLPADGEGRNAVYAAKMGWQVTAFDYSKSAVEKAKLLADQEKVAVEYSQCDVLDFHYPPDHFDAVGLIYVHLPRETRQYLFNKVVNTLKPGGVVIFEAFSKKQIGNTSGGPKNLDMLFSVEELQDEFKDLEISFLQAQDTVLEEGLHHQGTASIIRMVASKALL